MYNKQFNQQHAGSQTQNCDWTGFGRKHFGDRKAWAKQFFDMKNGQTAKVNIRENDEAFVIDVYAAGRKKENFSLAVKENILSISCTASEINRLENYTFCEETNTAFERKFQLEEKVLEDKIMASYEDGVLRVTLPKDPAAVKPAQFIPVQ